MSILVYSEIYSLELFGIPLSDGIYSMLSEESILYDWLERIMQSGDLMPVGS